MNWIEKDKIAGEILQEILRNFPNNSILFQVSQSVLRELIIAGIDQTFKPEMIIELFDGWEKDDNQRLGFLYLNYLVHIDMLPKQMYFDGIDISLTTYRITLIPEKVIFVFPKPRTIGEFMSDCERAGIKLMLKQ